MLKKLTIAVAIAILPLCYANAAGIPDNLLGAVHFKLGSADMQENADRVLDVIFDEDVEVPACANITLVGHGCDLGSDQLNMSLGMYRAIAVRDALVQRGFSKDRIKVTSVGKRHPTIVWRLVYPDSRYDRVVEVFLDPRESWYDDFKCKQDIRDSKK
ncbi:MAG: OmpA family protein [Proteobacteria bacterium]|nr:OmpA family protein [Pseudomonadota bacterium]